MLTEEIKVKNYSTYKHYIKSLLGEEVLNSLIEKLGGEEKIMNASFGMTDNSGLAYDGAMVQQVLEMGKLAGLINDMLPESKRVTPSKIWKVILLQHISKVVMYQENLNNWEVQNRGLRYTWTNRDVVLKGGELSVLISMNCGVKFEDDEYEAMRILDKIKEDENARWGSTILSMIIRQVNEIVSSINRK